MQQEIWFQKYQVLGLLGSGGTAKVYLAKHILLNSYRAIKFISKDHPLYDSLHNEALILKNLKHSCIPIIYDIEENEEGSYIVEQYLEGNTLRDYVKLKGPLSEADIIDFGIQLCDVIHYLHTIDRPILYLDLKPENLIVTENGIKLIDFGSAVFCDQIKEDKLYSGTKGYAAPELYRRDRIDERCDVYGIGMLLFFMVAGKELKASKNKYANIDTAYGCSGQLICIINQCLKYNPASRYPSVLHLSKRLSALKGKRHFIWEPSQTTVIAVAGTQERVGVTHFSIRLCTFLKQHRLKCLYLEEEDRGVVRALKKHYQVKVSGDGICRVNSIDMLSDVLRKTREPMQYQIIVKDMGCLTNDKLEEFLQADMKLLILGAKEWELVYSEQVLSMVTEDKDMIYLFNFLNGKQFQLALKNMEHRHCYRIPYEPDPFASHRRKNDSELFWGLWDLMGSRKYQKQDRNQLKAGTLLKALKKRSMKNEM